MTAGELRVPALVACATGAGVLGALPILWARPGEFADRVAVALVIAAYAATAMVILLARPGNRVARLMMLGTIAGALGETLLGWGVQGWAKNRPGGRRLRPRGRGLDVCCGEPAGSYSSWVSLSSSLTVTPLGWEGAPHGCC